MRSCSAKLSSCSVAFSGSASLSDSKLSITTTCGRPSCSVPSPRLGGAGLGGVRVGGGRTDGNGVVVVPGRGAAVSGPQRRSRKLQRSPGGQHCPDGDICQGRHTRNSGSPGKGPSAPLLDPPGEGVVAPGRLPLSTPRASSSV